MRTLILFDSYFGNTEQIARAIGAGLPGEVEVRRVGEMTPDALSGYDLLLVGSPTRGFRASESTMKLLKALPAGCLKGMRVAAFDTRIDVKQVNNAFLTFMESIFGYAAEKIGKQLKQKGGAEALPPEGFIVTASEGPLREGEAERATEWGKRIQ